MTSGPLMACAALALVAAAGPPAAVGGRSAGDLELLVNGGFEDGLAGWRTVDVAGACRFEPDEREQAAGARSLRIEHGGGGGKAFLKQYVDLPVSEGEVRVSARFKVEKGARFELVFYFNDEGGRPTGKGPIAFLTQGRTGRRFEQESATYEIPEGAASCGIDVIVAQEGRLWLDGVSVAVVGAGLPELGPLELANPGFEEEVRWWRPLQPGSGTATAAVDRKVKATGEAALVLERSSPRLFPEDGVVADVPQVGRARRARLELAVRTEAGARGAVVLRALSARGVALATARDDVPPGAEGFARRELLLELPKETARLEVELRAGGAGRAWFDDLSLAKR